MEIIASPEQTTTSVTALFISNLRCLPAHVPKATATVLSINSFDSLRDEMMLTLPISVKNFHIIDYLSQEISQVKAHCTHTKIILSLSRSDSVPMEEELLLCYQHFILYMHV